jgi:hypothetical protein
MKTQKVVYLHSLIPAWIEHLQPPWGLNLHSKPIQVFSKQCQRWGQQMSEGDQQVHVRIKTYSNLMYKTATLATHQEHAWAFHLQNLHSKHIWSLFILYMSLPNLSQGLPQLQVKRRQRKPQLNDFTKPGQWAQVEGRSKPHSDKRSEDCMSKLWQ